MSRGLQQRIVDYLNAKQSEFEAMDEKTREVIDRLTEYRTALITAATTGKIDVRNVKIPSNAARNPGIATVAAAA